jgi:hypothetical protein
MALIANFKWKVQINVTVPLQAVSRHENWSFRVSSWH